MARDRYEETLWRLIRATEHEGLQWRAVSPTSFERILTNPDRVVRAFLCNLELSKDKSFPVLLVERKELAYDEFSREFDRIECEIYVLNGEHELILPIYDGLVDRDDLFRLMSAASDSSDQAREFFEALSGAGDAT